MSKTLSNILTFFKVARIIAKVVYILCIVSGAICLVALIAIPMLGDLVEESLLSTWLASAIMCVGEAIFAFLAERYFKKVLDAGTPFTFDGAKECFRLGIAAIIVSVATSVIAGIAFMVLWLMSMDASEFDFSMSVSLATGVVLLFMSLIFKHGTELRESVAVSEKEEQAADPESL